jgi:hypothetical protein
MTRVRDVQPIRVRLMRETDFAGLPSSLQLVHLRECQVESPRPKQAREPSLSAMLIKRSRSVAPGD